MSNLNLWHELEEQEEPPSQQKYKPDDPHSSPRLWDICWEMSGWRRLILGRWWDHRLRTVVISGGKTWTCSERIWKRQGKEMRSRLVWRRSWVFTFSFTCNMNGFFKKEPDTEYSLRYWSFMETHPAHNSLPAKVKMDVLTRTGKFFFSFTHSRTPFQFH